jgi:hypothetical protein
VKPHGDIGPGQRESGCHPFEERGLTQEKMREKTRRYVEGKIEMGEPREEATNSGNFIKRKKEHGKIKPISDVVLASGGGNH